MPWTKLPEMLREPDSAEAPGRRIGYAEAVREGVSACLERDSRVFVMGQGVDDPGGMFGVTRGLHEHFGRARVFDTPLSETALTGVAAGAAMAGMRPIYLHNRPDFLYLAMDQLVNHAAKWHYMFGGAVSVPLVVWACIGRGWGSAAQHSQAPQGMFMHTPGLKLVMPSTCHDAKGLLIAAVRDENPVLILDHRMSFRNQGAVPEETYAVPLGRAAVRRTGRDLTIVGISHLAVDACLAAEGLAGEGIEAEVIDPRTLSPLDEDTILTSVAKTGRLVVADTGWPIAGAADAIVSLAARECFDKLVSAPAKVTPPALPTPAGCTLEEAYYVGVNDIAAAARRVMANK